MSGLALMLLSPNAAYADSAVITGDINEIAVEHIDSSRVGTLTVVKDGGNPYDAQVPGNKHVIKDVKFTAYKLTDFDLTQVETWETLKKLNYQTLKSAKRGSSYVALTDQTGYAVFNKLPVGVYLVEEELPADAKDALKAEPFIVTIPTGKVGSQAWSYDVKVNAKNVPNIPPKPRIPKIPETGMTNLAGIILIAGGAGSLLLALRKREANNA